MLSFFLKKTARYPILETIKPNIETKKQFCFFNFVFEVIKWVMIDNILHSSSSWFAKFDLFRLNSIKNVSLQKLFLVLYIMICYIAFLKYFLDFLIVYTIRIISCNCVLNSVTKVFLFSQIFLICSPLDQQSRMIRFKQKCQY